MEPSFHTAPALREVLAELQAREPIFHKPDIWNKRDDYEQLMHPAYWEVGASGKRYSREFILRHLETRSPDPTEGSWVVRDFQVREIAPHNYLATYTLAQGERLSRRSTWWRRTAESWQILYHQGTLADAQP
jgi:hypothetical protein